MSKNKKTTEEDTDSCGGDHTIITSVERVHRFASKNAYILFLSGPLVGKLHMLSEGSKIMGRGDDCDIVINDARVSRHHVELSMHSEKVVVRDMGSTNGTFVNGKRIESCVLSDGDKVQISSCTVLKFA